MSGQGTPPLPNTKHRGHTKKKKRVVTSSSDSSTASDSADNEYTKSRSRTSRKRRRSYSSSSSVASSPIRSKRSRSSKSDKRRKTQSPGSNYESSILRDLITALDNRNRTPQSHGSQNVIPEFDPQAKNQTMKDWLSKINESAHVYGWSEKQTTFYVLPRLTGLAKRWYDGLTSVKYSWKEWQEKLLRAFPGEENYGDILTEMLARKSRRNESLEEYYYDKIRLINRCEISGTKAVDCLTHGIYDYNIRMGAQGLCFNEPEDLLTHFRRISTKRDEVVRSSGGARDRVPSVPQNRSSTVDGSSKKTGIKCFNCNEKGHVWQSCSKELVKCVKCNRIGHNTIHCNRTPYNANKSQSGSIAPKTINKIESESGSNDKYIKDVLVNTRRLKGFLDLGSECTLLSNDIRMDLTLQSDDRPNMLPMLKGFASGSIQPQGKVKIQVQVDSLSEEIDAYLVPRDMLPYGTDILVGQNLTELPGVRVYKTDSELILFKVLDRPTEIIVEETVEINGATVVPVTTSECLDHASVYISSDICLKPGVECLILPGVYSFVKGRTNIVMLGLNHSVGKVQKGQLVARGLVLPDFVLCQQNKKIEQVEKQNRVENIWRITDRETDDIQLHQINMDEDLPSEIKNELGTLLNENRDAFAFSTSELGKTNLTEMHIKLKDDTPITYRPYRLSISERQRVKDMLEDLCANGIIRESESEYASPVIVVPKKNGELRLCVDYRALNKKTVKDKYPMPLIEDQIDSLCGQSFFTTLDLTSGYHQIPVAENSKHLTAFVTQDGHFEYNRVPFGLCNAPAVFQRLIHKVLNAKKIPGVLAYMDDIVISSKTVEEGMSKLRQVLEALKEANLTLNLSKCHFFRKCIEYLGYEISCRGVQPGQKKTEAVALFKRPENVHEVRQFIGLASFFRRFVPGFAVLARPLTCLTKANEKWVWEEVQENAFNTIKQILISRPVLAIYDPTLLTELHTDASQVGIGGMLMQRPDEKSPLRVVAYFSRQTTAEEQHFHSFELETLAVVMSLIRFRSYLIGVEFKIVTDCNAVRQTWAKRDLVPRIARWWLLAQEFNFAIEYRPGAQMSHVDALSRNPLSSVETNEPDKVTAHNVLSIRPCLEDIQYTDPQLTLIKCILNSNCKEAKDIKNHYVLKDGKLYRNIDDALKWVVPQDARWKVCHMSHDEFGHMGIEKTLDKMKQNYWFRQMATFVKKYVRACIPCAFAKQPTGKKEGFLHPIPKTPEPFHSVHIDHLGPFVKSKTGNTYILGIIDGYSKFIILRAVRNTKSKTTIAVLRDVFGIFDAPKLLISDRGTSFTSKEFAEFARELEIKHVKNAVAMPRANGQIERYNRTILASLIALTHGENDKNWDTHVNTVQWSLNNTVNKGIGKTPAEAVFSKRTLHFSEGHLHDLTCDDTQPRESMPEKIREEITATINDNQAKMEKRFNEKRRVAKEYEEGDLVLVQKQLNNIGESNKLLPRYSGPYRVTKVLGLDRYEVSSIDGYAKRKYQNVYAADKMKPWISFTLSGKDKEPKTFPDTDENILPNDTDSDDRESD